MVTPGGVYYAPAAVRGAGARALDGLRAWIILVYVPWGHETLEIAVRPGWGCLRLESPRSSRQSMWVVATRS
eukprot:COSAG02_NODE_328_length_24547_cov_4.124141_3_plen_72_part_00